MAKITIATPPMTGRSRLLDTQRLNKLEKPRIAPLNARAARPNATPATATSSNGSQPSAGMAPAA